MGAGIDSNWAGIEFKAESKLIIANISFKQYLYAWRVLKGNSALLDVHNNEIKC